MKKLFGRILPFLLVIVLALSACASAASPTQSQRGNASEESAAEAPAAPEPAYDSTNFAVPGAAQAPERIIIKNASLSLVVASPPASMEKIARMAEEMGGFVVTANLSETQLETGLKVPRGNLTIRVPAERLNEALEQIRAESDRLPISDELSSQDVTSEYTDLQSRLGNLEAAEKQLTKIMEDANRTEDVLSVYNQLVQVREQIEVIKGQIKYYEQSAALSEIEIELLANEAVQPLSIGGWQPAGVAKEAVQASIDSLKFLANAVIWIVLFVVPVLLVIYLLFVLPVTLIIRRLRRARTNRPSPPSPAAPPAQPQA